jgi:hypothetical protein
MNISILLGAIAHSKPEKSARALCESQVNIGAIA